MKLPSFELNDPIDLLALKFLGLGIKLDFNATLAREGEFLPETGELCLEVALIVFRWRKVWLVSRRRS